MKPAARALLMLLLTVCAAAAVAGGSDVLLDALLQRPRGNSVVVVPDTFVRPWDPITIFFPSDRGPAGGGAEPSPERHVTLDPEWPGAWTWLDARTLQFRPADPYPPLEVLTVDVRGARATTTLSTLMTPPALTSPRDGERDLPPVEQIALTFAEPIAADALARMVTIDVRPLPGLSDVGARVLTRRDLEVKVVDRRSPSDQASYRLVLNHPIPLGHRATVRFGLSLDDRDEAVSTFTFDTAQPFRVASVGCGDQSVPMGPEGVVFAADNPLRCTAGGDVRIDFTARPSPIGPVEGRNLVRFEPSVPDLDWRVSGRTLLVHGAFRPDVPYRVSVAPTAITDDAGRPLELRGEGVVWMHFPRRERYLHLDQGQGIVERFGPQRIPLEGRAHQRVDVRIHRVDPLNRNLWPFPGSAPIVDEAQRPPGPGEQPPDWAGTPGGSSPLPPGELAARLAALGSPGVSRVVDLPVGADDGAARFGLDVAPLLKELSGANAPGHYLVGIRRLDAGTVRTWMRLQVTDLSLSTVENPTDVVFAVSSLASGRAVPGATVRIEGEVRQSQEPPRWKVLWEGRTGRNGLVTWNAPGPRADTRITVHRLVVEHGDDRLVLQPRLDEAYRDGHWHADGAVWLQWGFADLDRRGEADQMLGHLFVDRPVYRPGDEVHLKGFVRRRTDGRLGLVDGAGQIEVVAPGGTRWSLPVEVSATGSVYARWQADDPPTGVYSATLSLPVDGRVQRITQTTFGVEAYRLPTFEVQLHPPDGRTEVANDRPFDVTLTASYYAGGRVAGRPVRWRVTQFPYAWSPPSTEGFYWSSDGRYGRATGFRATPALSLSTTTAVDGSASLSLDPGIEADARPRTYVIEATVTGADDQTVTDTLQVHAVPAFVLGLKVPRYVDNATSIPAQVIAVGPNGTGLGGKELTVRLIRRQWHSVLQASDFSDGEARYLTDVVEVPVREETVHSHPEALDLDLPIDEAGVYVVELEARDVQGRVQVVRVDLFASGEQPQAWDKPKAGTFELTADQPGYRPGQRARILIRSPYQRAEALVVTETPRGNRYEMVPVRGGTGAIDVEIEEGWVPRIPVHVLLWRGRASATTLGAAGETDLGKPQTVASTLWLAVEPVENTLDVELVHPERALPGQTIPMTVRLADPRGRPLAGEVTLWLVDQAVLALGTEQRLDPLPDFLPDRSSHVQLRDTRNLAFGTVPTEPMPGGDGEDAEGEGIGDLLSQATIRKDFKPVAFYEPSLKVGPSGQVTVKVALPDNLTVFKVRAKAVSGVQRLGVGSSSVAVRLPVVVQPTVPRFVRPGDRFDASALVRVVEGEGGAGAAQIEVDGLLVTGPRQLSLNLDRDVATRVMFPIEVPTPEIRADGTLARDAVTITLGATRAADRAADAAQTVLPLRDDRQPQIAHRLVDLEPGGRIPIEPIPADARPGSIRRLVVVADHAGLVKLAAGLDILRRNAPRNTGERLARARVLIGLGALREPLGLGTEGDDAEVRAAVEELFAWMPAAMDRAGRVGQWPGTPGTVSLTADALTFLVEATEAGYRADGPLEDALVRSLRAGLRSDDGGFLDGESWFERAKALWALSGSGRFDDAYFAELSRSARSLGPDGASYVLLAADRSGQLETAAARQLRERLSDEITVQLVQGNPRYAGLTSLRTDRNPRIATSEAQTLAHVVQALYRAKPSDPKLPVAVDALVRLGSTDGWGNAEADAAALFALAGRGGRAGGTEARIEIEGTTAALQLTPEAPAAHWVSGLPGGFELVHVSGHSATALVIDRWIPAADGASQAPEAGGFVVAREWRRIRAGGPSDKILLDAAGMDLPVEVGDVVEEHVQLVNPAERYHLVLSVPLAAGMEPLNPALATAPPEARPEGRTTARPSWVAIYDDVVHYGFEQLPAGTWDVFFRTRATVRGRFVQPPARAEMIYDRSVVGRSAGARVVVSPASPQ